MRDNAWTSAARLRPGDRVKLRLRPWPDVSAQYEKFNRTELDDSALQLEEPVWGEDVEVLKRSCSGCTDKSLQFFKRLYPIRLREFAPKDFAGDVEPFL